MRILFLLPALAILSGCTEQPAATGPTPNGYAPATYVYNCEDGYTFTARIENATARLLLPSGSLRLTRLPAASGSKYAYEGNMLRIRDETARLEQADGTGRNCVNDRKAAVWEHARLNGVKFRATGNEPGWHIEIDARDNIILVTDYGSSRYRFEQASLQRIDAGESRYRARSADHGIEVSLFHVPCRDTMAGDTYDVRVIVKLDGIELRGCGRTLH